MSSRPATERSGFESRHSQKRLFSQKDFKFFKFEYLLILNIFSWKNKTLNDLIVYIPYFFKILILFYNFDTMN